MADPRTDDRAGKAARPPDASMSLLNDLLSHPVDEDYAPVAQRRRGGTREHTPGGMAGLMAVLVVFGLLIVTMVLQTNRAAPAVEEERAQLIERINEEGEEVETLRQTATSLEASVARLEDRVLSRSRIGQALQARLLRLGVLSGTIGVRGPGIVITVDDAEDAADERAGQVLDTDLQKLVNALWVAGAEAVAIDNQRITSRTAIRGAGSAITVNYRSLTRPYVVQAIGNPDTLPARLLETEGGRAWLDLQVNFGVQFSTETRRNITLPVGAPPPIRFAQVPGSDQQ
ncbi:MAG TPA: DUF881 domain-containing protein [Nocardioidaceae bacterium]|nr:DUF881 domain-containing protein [Nocardioidaceae bacterium]